MRGHTAAATAPCCHALAVAGHRPLARLGARKPTSSSYTDEEEAPAPPPLQLGQQQSSTGRAGDATLGSQQPAESRLRPRSTHARGHRTTAVPRTRTANLPAARPRIEHPDPVTQPPTPQGAAFHLHAGDSRRRIVHPGLRSVSRPPLQAQAKIRCRRDPSAPHPPTSRQCPKKAAAPHLQTVLFLSQCSPPCAATLETSTASPA
ncbi:hypothetical protein ACQJBY_017814 [Aegilops geniculata]